MGEATRRDYWGMFLAAMFLLIGIAYMLMGHGDTAVLLFLGSIILGHVTAVGMRLNKIEHQQHELLMRTRDLHTD